MKKGIYSKLIAWSILVLVGGCIDPYRPPEVTSPGSYLVVSGFFNSAPGTKTSIQLSRTQNLTDTKAPTVETKAQVSIESSRNASYKLQEESGGVYSLSGVVPSPSETYRLRIRTAQGTEYLSEFVPVNTTPPIDSISWRAQEDGVQINVNTHDPTNKTRYYRWEYDEAWEYVSAYQSTLELVRNQLVPRTEDVFRCWGTYVDRTIQLASSVRLSQDVISQRPMRFIPSSSVKLGIKYSIQVKQTAMTEAAFSYYEQLAKITQNVGSIFDPQPSMVVGNIHPVANSSELVMGFFRVGTVETKRLFIRKAQLPSWVPITGNGNCMLDTLTLQDIREQQPAVIVPFDMGTYLTTTFDCVDCRLRGGVIKKPDYWDQ